MCDACVNILDAIKNNHMNCFKKFHKLNPNNLNKSVCRLAAEEGRLNLLRLAHHYNYPWDKSTCEAAAKKGHLDCLKCAHENGCPWDVQTCRNAVQSGNLSCLEYVHQNGCELNDDIYFDAMRCSESCLEYIKKYYPINEEDKWFYEQPCYDSSEPEEEDQNEYEEINYFLR